MASALFTLPTVHRTYPALRFGKLLLKFQGLQLCRKKMKKNLAAATIISGAFLISCGESVPTRVSMINVKTKTETGALSNTIRYSVNGKKVLSSGWNISRFDMGKGPGLNITSNMHEDPRTVLFNVNGIKPGTYALSEDGSGAGTAYGSYRPDYKNEMLNAYSFTSGSLIIDLVDTAKGSLTAHFEGIARNAKGEQVSIADGEVIEGKLAPGITKY
jgi:hypothetical protein